jgi:hypothetical protein
MEMLVGSFIVISSFGWMLISRLRQLRSRSQQPNT